MFVHPAQIDRVVKRHPELLRARLVVDSKDGKDSAALVCESSAGDDSLIRQVEQSIQAECKLRATVRIVAPNTIPNDGKVIEDVRNYE